MNSRALTLSLVIAFIAVFMVSSYIEGREAQFKQEYGTPVPVVVAKTDIKELELIDDRKVTIKTVPQKFKLPGAFTKVEELYNTIASVPITKGEQITKPRITYPGARSGLSRQVSIGKRALSIQVSEEQAVSKLIKPGDRVDILAFIDYAGGRKEKFKVKTVLQDVYVLATGLSVTKEIPLLGIKVDSEIKKMNLNNYTNYNTVTLELSPYEAQKMIFVMKGLSGIYLSLRNNDDKKLESIAGTKLFDVLGDDAGEVRSFFQQQQEKRNQTR